MLSNMALITLVLAVGTQAPLPKKKTKHSHTPAAATPATSSTTSSTRTLTPDGFFAVRSADCVLALKGQMVRRFSMIPLPQNLSTKADASATAGEKKASPTPAHRISSGQILEHFDYELPGTLTEETDPKGTRIRFRFVPVPQLQPGTAQAKLHLEDQSKGPGFPPTVVDATEVLGVDPFIFEAAARGQRLFPVSGSVILKGRVQNASSAGSPVSMLAPLGPPVISLPLPPVNLNQEGPGKPSLQFQGASLWAWPNSKGPFTVASTIIYNPPGSQVTITGSVEVAFRVGATQ